MVILNSKKSRWGRWHLRIYYDIRLLIKERIRIKMDTHLISKYSANSTEMKWIGL